MSSVLCNTAITSSIPAEWSAPAEAIERITLTELVRGHDQDLFARLAPVVRRQSLLLDLELVERIDAAGIAALITDKTRLLWIESPGSVTMEVGDLPALARAVFLPAPDLPGSVLTALDQIAFGVAAGWASLAWPRGFARAGWLALNRARRRPAGSLIPTRCLIPWLVVALIFGVVRNLPLGAFLSP